MRQQVAMQHRVTWKGARLQPHPHCLVEEEGGNPQGVVAVPLFKPGGVVGGWGGGEGGELQGGGVEVEGVVGNEAQVPFHNLAHGEGDGGGVWVGEWLVVNHAIAIHGH